EGEGAALRHRPRGEHAAALQPEVVMQAAGVVPLDHEQRVPPPASRTATGGKGFRRFLRIPFASVVLQTHIGTLPGPGFENRPDENTACKRYATPQELLHKGGGSALEAGFYRPRVIFRAGEKAVDSGGKSSPDACLRRRTP